MPVLWRTVSERKESVELDETKRRPQLALNAARSAPSTRYDGLKCVVLGEGCFSPKHGASRCDSCVDGARAAVEVSTRDCKCKAGYYDSRPDDVGADTLLYNDLVCVALGEGCAAGERTDTCTKCQNKCVGRGRLGSSRFAPSDGRCDGRSDGQSESRNESRNDSTALEPRLAGADQTAILCAP